MMKRIFAILLVVFMLTFCVMGCGNNEEPQTPCEELITKEVELKDIEYCINYFCAFAHSGLFISQAELQEQLPVECVRETNNKYVVFEVAEGGRVYVFFKGDLVNHSVWVKEPLEWKTFKKLDEGDTMADVAGIDPVIAMYSGETPYNVHWIYAGKDQEGKNLYSAFSLHLLDDRLVAIQYETVSADVDRNSLTKDQFVISEIEVFDDFNYIIDREGSAHSGEYNFTILDQDYVK